MLEIEKSNVLGTTSSRCSSQGPPGDDSNYSESGISVTKDQASKGGKLSVVEVLRQMALFLKHKSNTSCYPTWVFCIKNNDYDSLSSTLSRDKQYLSTLRFDPAMFDISLPHSNVLS